ncbi:MAG: GNAT family N-acetyltransferase [Lachnospiraceae bacterium]|nr:GNAT family N-acetyltransferase [Lachnospiraceae bacterium]
MMEIRKGSLADIPQIVRIYEHILDEEEQGSAVTGWIRGVYPTEQTALEALEAKELFVLQTDGTVAVAARINQVQVPEYAHASWEFPDAPKEQIMVLHTLVVDPAFAGRGYGSRFVEFYEQYAKERGCLYLRMDTNARNQAARRLYRHLGYREAGIVPCEFNGIPEVQLVCLEKALKQKNKE